ncbi:MAG: hypothetical protein CMN89_14125, partial [Sutterellaceae bacterium]|nr:hypothetical protein [Sutterellaceae bacterium]
NSGDFNIFHDDLLIDSNWRVVFLDPRLQSSQGHLSATFPVHYKYVIFTKFGVVILGTCITTKKSR